jgi:hypothetical protein
MSRSVDVWIVGRHISEEEAAGIVDASWVLEGIFTTEEKAREVLANDPLWFMASLPLDEHYKPGEVVVLPNYQWGDEA